MKKTLLVTCDFYPAVGGVSRYWMSLGSQFSSSQWVVLAPRRLQLQKELESTYRIYRRTFFSKLFWPRWIPLCVAICEIIIRERPSVIIAAQVLPVGTAVYVLARFFSVPYIVSTHGMDVTVPLTISRKKRLCARIFSNAAKIITVSKYTAKKIQEYGVEASKIDFVFPCPAALPEQDPQAFAAPRNEYRLLTVGRIVKRKGHEYVLKTLAELKSFSLPIQYSIVGDGHYKENLVRLAQKLGVSDRVFFTGALSDADVAQKYAECDIFIMTPCDIDGDVEGFGIVYLEANFFGKAVIGTRTGGVEDAVIDRITGLLCEPKNTADIRNAIVTLLSNEILRTKLGAQGKQRVEQDFNWAHQAKKLSKIIDSV